MCQQGPTSFDVKIPSNTFSDRWSPANGEHTAECAKGKDLCLTATPLSQIMRSELWAPGVDGKTHLEIQPVSAEEASGERVALVL